MHSLEISGNSASPTASAPEKRPTFAFHRRIRDDPAFAPELPSSPLLHYAAVVKSAGGAIHDLVREWTEVWLEGVGVRGGADAEALLRGMVEEVIWGNVTWYGIGGWASRGVDGRGFNADFFVYVLLCSVSSPVRATTNFYSYSARTLSPQRPSSRRSSSRTNRLLRRATPVSRSPAASCFSRRTFPCQQPCTSRAATTGTRCPSQSSTPRRTP
jgi:hypothetical protein